MLTTDIALKVDPAYREITSRWLDNPEEFEDAFARAWFKLTHRDLGPTSRYLGDLAPDQEFVWQDPVPEVDHAHVPRGRPAPRRRGALERRDPRISKRSAAVRLAGRTDSCALPGAQTPARPAPGPPPTVTT